MTQPWARIVIVAYQSGQHLQTCVDSLSAQSAQNFEVVIVNNQCPDDCTDDIALPNDRYRIVDAPLNLGFAAGSNFGAKGAKTPWIITLNPDAWPTKTWFHELMSVSFEHSDATMLSSTLLQQDDPSLVDGFGDAYSVYGIAWRGGYNTKVENLPLNNVEVFGPCGAAAAYRREQFEALGGFDEDFFCYLEDVDLALRMQQLGAKCLQVRMAEVLHYGSGSTGKGSDFQYYQTYKNNLRLIVKNAPAAILPIQLGAYAVSQTYIMLRNRKNAGASARWQGLKEGVRALPQSFRDRHSTYKCDTLNLARHIVWKPAKVSSLKPIFWSEDVRNRLTTQIPSVPVKSRIMTEFQDQARLAQRR